MAKLIEKKHSEGIYGMDCCEKIVEMPDGKRIYLVEGFGGMHSPEGGMYRWRHGLAIQVLPTDTLESLHADDDSELPEYQLMIEGHSKQRPVLDWDGKIIASVANSAK